MARKGYGDILAQELSDFILDPVATTTALKAIPSSELVDKILCIVSAAAPELAVYRAASIDTVDGVSVFVPDDIAAGAAYIADPTTAAGRWHMLGSASLVTTWKAPVRIASGGAVANLSNITVADFDGQGQGITLDEDDIVLVKDTASPDGVIAAHHKYDGRYVVGVVTAGHAALTRESDADASAEVVSGMAMFVSEGDAAGDIYILTTANPIVLGTTALTFALAVTTAPNATTLVKGLVKLAGDFGGTADLPLVLKVNGSLFQSGTTTLVAGVSPAIAATVTANTRILVSVKTMTPGAGNLTTQYSALAADRTVGAPGSFKITALVDAGTINVNDVSDVDWVAFG